MGEVIKAYKGFNKDMTCTPTDDIKFQYEEGKEYETESAECCERGFHACEYPLDCFKYYPPTESIYHEVEQSGDIDRSSSDSKISSTKIKIGARLSIAGIIQAQIEFVRNKIDKTIKEDKDSEAGGYRSNLAGGNRSNLAGGDRSNLVSRGTAEVKNQGIAVVRGNGRKAKGGMGSIILLVEENESDCDIKEWKAFQIDGETYKPNTWYKIEDGEVVEAEESEG